MKKTLFLLLTLFVGTAFAERAETPTKEQALTQGVKQVTIEEAKKLFDNGAIFLDARKPIDIARGKVKGALKASYNDKGGNKNKVMDWDKSKDSYTSDELPADKAKTIVTYCNGPKCWKSYKLAVVLANDLQYKDVNWLKDGFPAWKDSGNPIE